MQESRVLYVANLTGVKMGRLKSIADRVRAGSVVSIISRPDNQYDAQAMSVHFEEEVTDPNFLEYDVTAPQIGWIPNKEYEDKITKSILNNLAKYHQLFGVVTMVSPADYRCEINVCLGPEIESEEDEGEPGTADGDEDFYSDDPLDETSIDN